MNKCERTPYNRKRSIYFTEKNLETQGELARSTRVLTRQQKYTYKKGQRKNKRMRQERR